MRSGVRVSWSCIIGLALLWGGNPACADTLLNWQENRERVRTGARVGKNGRIQAELYFPWMQSGYRLGTEASTDFEFAVDYRRKVDKSGARDGAYFQSHFVVSTLESFNEWNGLGRDNVPQAYMNFANFLSPGVNVWLGRRNYEHKSTYLDNHYWPDAGQGMDAGLGFEGLKLGPGKLSAALFQTRDEDVRGLGGMGDDTGTLSSTILDVRFSEIKVNTGGTLTLWGQGTRRAAEESLGFEEKFGYGVGAWHRQKDMLGGSNTFAATYRKGAAVVQGNFNPNPVREDQGYDLDEASALEISNDFLMRPSGNFSMHWGAMARMVDSGSKGSAGSVLRRYSTSVRPVYHFADHINLETEFGIDYIDDERSALKGGVRKYTIALQRANTRDRYADPSIRLFFSKMTWDEASRGLTSTVLGDMADGGATGGWTVGVRMEMRW